MSEMLKFVERNPLSVLLPTLMMVAFNLLLTRKEPMWPTQPMNIILPLVVMTLISPGVIVSVPPDGKILFSGDGATMSQLVVHALAMLVILKNIRAIFPQYYSFAL